MKLTKLFVTAAAAVMLFVNGAFLHAQVTVGDDKVPEVFSLLELKSNTHNGLRLPQMTTVQRDAMANADFVANPEAMGLRIFNITTYCVETWNGFAWISQCYDTCKDISSVSVSPAADSAPVGSTVKLTASVSGSSSVSLTYLWERSFDQTNWFTVPSETGATYNAPAVAAGITYYRVSVSGCSTNYGIAAITGTGKELALLDGFSPYVGAFWRANQAGERLINIEGPTSGDADGKWAATVIDGADWIVLDTQPSADPGVESGNPAMDGNSFESDPNYHLSSSATTFVSGTLSSGGKIYFRIGLTGTIASNAHRYGVVLLSYKDNTLSQRIFIRQGEEADYLMRPADGGRGTDAARVAAFNIKQSGNRVTWDGRRPGTDGSGPGSTEDQQNAYFYFTDYPSQAGAFFQWANPHEETVEGFGGTVTVTATWRDVAWYPAEVSPLKGWSSLSALGWQNYTWDATVPAAGSTWVDYGWMHESCPDGYRRPIEGSVSSPNSTGAISGSEMRQSLWLNPQAGAGTDNTDNSLWGYYADGFFDRRIVTNNTVSGTDDHTAYAGNLFYNPTTNASVFFPAAGYRNTNSAGALEPGTVGISGYYWTSGVRTDGNAWYMNVSNAQNANMNSLSYPNALSVRCVAIEGYVFGEYPY